MPVRDIQVLLADPSDANVKQVLAAHRTRLEHRLSQVADRLDAIDRIVKEGNLLRKSHSAAREGFVPVRVESVVSQVPTAARWSELREKVPMIPAEPQEVHVVTLVSRTGDRIPLWVGSFEGNCMKLQLEGIATERPMTYELMLHALEAHGAQVVRAEVVRKVDSTFFAQLTTVSDGNERTLDCRPSDALNLALRAGAPIAVAQEVLDEVRADGETAST